MFKLFGSLFSKSEKTLPKEGMLFIQRQDLSDFYYRRQLFNNIVLQQSPECQKEIEQFVQQFKELTDNNDNAILALFISQNEHVINNYPAEDD